MNTPEPADIVRPGRALLALALLFGGAGVLGLLAAPPVFHGILYVGRTVEALEGLRNIPFERVANRCVLLGVLLGLWPAFRFGRIRFEALGYSGGVSWLRPAGYGWMAGVLSILLLYAIGWMSGAYVWEPRTHVNLIGRVLGFLVGGWVVGLIEETLFRGWLFGMMRRSTGFWVAALVSSILFSAVHFISPDPPLGIVHAPWYAGFALLPHAYTLDGAWEAYFPYAVTLAVMGLVLCALLEYSRHIYFIIGLHAGWVVILQSGRYFWSAEPERLTWLFGVKSGLAYAPVTLVMGVLWLAGVLWLMRRK